MKPKPNETLNHFKARLEKAIREGVLSAKTATHCYEREYTKRNMAWFNEPYAPEHCDGLEA
jgi:predicted GNAT superfamily acetyltransferase